MADKTITVRENTSFTLTLQLRTFRNESAPTAIQNIAGYAFRLVVKRDRDDADAIALVNLAGAIVTAASGTFSFTLTPAHTALASGTYPGEIRWWSSGTVTDPPTDAWTADYVVARRLIAP